jgi:hypothetical protein
VDKERLIVSSKDQLNLVLSFFPRVESRSSVVLAVDTGMAAFLSANAPPLHSFTWPMAIISGLTVIFLGVSVILLYWGSSPNLKGGEGSLVYFGELTKRTEHKFIEEFSAQSDKQYADELLSQAWRNAKILGIKFFCLKWAFRFMALAIIPWILCLLLFASYSGPHTSLFKQ